MRRGPRCCRKSPPDISRRWANIAQFADVSRNEIPRHPAQIGAESTGPLPDDIANRVLARLAALETNPRPPNVKKLKGRDGWRIRIGDYRIIYDIDDPTLQVLVITVGPRREVYQ
ncbi:MAG: type II toxin-antitoxin system RelE/ParE family toxin [Verrucomicrobiota bacterium]